MIDIINKIPQNWSIIYLGLKNNWLSTKDVFSIVNSTSYNKEREDFIIDLNICEHKNEILNLIENNFSINESLTLEIWQFAFLFNVNESKMQIIEKLESIAELWAKFDYPDEWGTFIHYMPNDNCNSPEDVYKKFQVFLSEKRKKLELI